MQSDHGHTFDSIYTHLTLTYGFPVFARESPRPYEPALSHTIAELSIHPCLEALLHILNADLTSAHFLCRHMQSKPAWEGMFLHGILHRIEGDIENAKAWYSDVAESEAFQNSWPNGLDEAKGFLAEVQDARRTKSTNGSPVNYQLLVDLSHSEIEALAKWCKKQFGVEKLENAQEAWVEPDEKQKELAARMVVGGEGWREF